jgi:molybdopterin-synthase adenylyltransferase
MNDEQLLRYSRHILLPQIEFSGQQKLSAATVLIVGVGGLGSPAAMYLASSGIGHIILVDHDKVELTNLQRQVIYNTAHIGAKKVIAAKQQLLSLNPDIQVSIYAQPVSEILARLPSVDVILDCSDNFATRFALNRYSIKNAIPLVSAAAWRFQGQLTTFLPTNKDSPCYHCLYPDIAEYEPQQCANSGVISPIVGIIGSLQAAQTILILLNIGHTLCGKLLLVDGFTMRWRTVALAKDTKCSVCSSK